MKFPGTLPTLPAMLLAAAGLMQAQAPTVDTFKQVLQQQLLKLRPDGMTERNVLFQQVRAGAANGGEYPFLVTALIRDYGAGYPANRYYGETCVSRMSERKFFLSKDEFGRWQAQGAMTVSLGPDVTCKANPSAGVSSIPLASLQGSPAPAGVPATAGPSSAGPGELATGEWACYGSGGRLLVGLGFRITGQGKYTDLDRKNAGSYTVQGGAIAFHGGALDGQKGRNLKGNHFDLSGTVSCEVFH